MPCSTFSGLVLFSVFSKATGRCSREGPKIHAVVASLVRKAVTIATRTTKALVRVESSIGRVKTTSAREARTYTEDSDSASDYFVESDADLEATPVDFTGHWLLVAVEEDPYGLMEATGVPYTQKHACWAAGYGVNHVHAIIEQMGDNFRVTSQTPFGQSTVKFVVGAGRQTAKASNGMFYKLKPVWYGNELCSTLYKDGYAIQQRRFMRGGHMCIESAYGGKFSTEVYRLEQDSLL